MTRISGLTISLIALVAGPAMAADMPVKAPLRAVTAYSWTGFYVGGNVGGNWQRASFESNLIGCNVVGCASGLPHIGFDPAIAAAGTGSNTQGGFTAGGQVGYNWQINSLVLGVEADINALSGKPAIAAAGAVSVNTGTFTLANSASADWLATVRGRAGFAADRFLIYATGGVAFAHIKFSQSFSDICCTSSTPLTTFTTSATKTGYAVGGGLEYAFASNWSLRGEYLYAGGFGAVGGSYVATSVNGNGDLHSGSARLSIQQARLGLNYKFN
jgi:outer membrane immunogenic protein